jgi:cobalt-zinc-cadmium efflux system outer membrane protein
MPRKWLPGALAVLLASGCTYPVRDDVDRAVCDLAAHPLDVQPPGPIEAPRQMPRAEARRAPNTPDPPAAGTGSRQGELVRTASQVPPGGETPSPLPLGRKELFVPPELPGANVPPLQWPTPEEGPARREAAAERLFPELPLVSPEPQPLAGPNGQPLTLTDLQQLAMVTSPTIREAEADLKAAQGAFIQAGAYPNPNVGYEEDTGNDGGTAGFQGGFIEQVVKTAGKLKLAQAAAQMDVLNADLAVKAAKSTVASQVRSGYFAVLVAQENLKISRALVRLTDEIYQREVAGLRFGQVAPYEPVPFRVLANQGRMAYIQALNRYYSAWHQLAAAVGRPDMPPTQLAGRPDMPLPVYRYDAVLARVLGQHTDVLTAQNSIQKARYNLRLTQVTPISDVDVRAVVQKDFTTAPFLIAHTLTVGVTVPVWDQNKGNIIQAQGNLLHAVEDVHRVRDDLTTRLSDAFERYENNRVLLEYYRDRILPDQVFLFRQLYTRFRGPGEGLTLIDISTAQQNLATSLATYLTTLAALWTAVSDVAGLLQTDDLFQVAAGQCPAPLPDLDHLAYLACSHPCSPLPGPINGANGAWPPAEPPKSQPVMPHVTDRAGPAALPEPKLPAEPPGGEEQIPSFPVPLPGSAPRREAGVPDRLPEALELPALPLPRPVNGDG